MGFVGTDKRCHEFLWDASSNWYSKSSTGITLTIASPCVVSWGTHGFGSLSNMPIVFSTTGALPTGITAGNTYYVEYKDNNTFYILDTPGGTRINTSGTQSGTHTATVPTDTLYRRTTTILDEPFRNMNLTGQAESTQTLASSADNCGTFLPAKQWKWANYSTSIRCSMQPHQDAYGTGCLETWNVDGSNVLMAEFQEAQTLNVGEALRLDIMLNLQGTVNTRGSYLHIGFMGESKSICYLPITLSNSAVSVSALANNGSGLVRVTTGSNHLCETDDVVIITGTSNTAANGLWKITKISATQYDLQGSTWAGSTSTGNMGLISVSDTSCKLKTYSDLTMPTAGTDLTKSSAPIYLLPGRAVGSDFKSFILEIEKTASSPDLYTIRFGGQTGNYTSPYRSGNYFTFATALGAASSFTSSYSLTDVAGIPSDAITGIALRLTVNNTYLGVYGATVRKYVPGYSASIYEPNWAGACVLYCPNSASSRTCTLTSNVTTGRLALIGAYVPDMAGSGYTMTMKTSTCGLPRIVTQGGISSGGDHTIGHKLDIPESNLQISAYERSTYIDAAVSGAGGIISRGGQTTPKRFTSANTYTGQNRSISGMLGCEHQTAGQPDGLGVGTDAILLGTSGTGGLETPSVAFGAPGESNNYAETRNITANGSGFTPVVGTYRNYIMSGRPYGTSYTGTVTLSGTVTIGASGETSNPFLRQCRSVATSNQTLSGEKTISGVALVSGDTVLLQSQTAGVERGPWVVSTGAWSRPSWFSAGSSSQAFYGLRFLITEGTYANWIYYISTTTNIVIDTDGMTIAQATRRSDIIAGTNSTLVISGKITETAGGSGANLGWNASGFGFGILRPTNTDNDYKYSNLLVGGTLEITADVPATSNNSLLGYSTGVAVGDGSNTSIDVKMLMTGAYTFSRNFTTGSNPISGKVYIGGSTAHTSAMAGNIVLNGMPIYLTAASGGTFRVTGSVNRNASTNYSVYKSGLGTAEINNSSNSNQGALYIDEGTLLVSGTYTAATGATVADGAVLEVTGTLNIGA
jgi:autotransporter-associated beta strand protein